MTYIKIATTSFSAASTVNVDNVFSASYTHYLVTGNVSSSVGTSNGINLRMRVSGADDSGANYRRQYVLASSTAVSATRETASAQWNSALGYPATTAIGPSYLRISNPFDTVRTTAWNDHAQEQAGNISLVRHVFAHDLTTSYTGFTLIPVSGTITGSVTVYGLKES